MGMRSYRGRNTLIIAGVLALLLSAETQLVFAANKAEIDSKVSTSLKKLYDTEPAAKALGGKAKAVLVFPDIVKGGFIVAGEYGDGALLKGNNTAGYYRALAASVGFQAGAQSFGYVLFFMDDDSLAYLDKSDGWELGTGPTLVVLDKGFGKNFSTTTLQKGVYAIIFNQKGLMGGISLQGSKITKITPDK
jgi:lipid-binding SYLF domain-containing protein